MSQIVGLIELEPGGTTVADLAAPCDDATLEALFIRLVSADDDDATDEDSSTAVSLAADLDLLREDLAKAAHRLRQNIWLAHSTRR